MKLTYVIQMSKNMFPTEKLDGVSVCGNSICYFLICSVFLHGTSREKLTGNLFHLFFAELFSCIIFVAYTSRSKKIIYIVYKFFKEPVAWKSGGEKKLEIFLRMSN